jgi:hypothetical protein
MNWEARVLEEANNMDMDNITDKMACSESSALTCQPALPPCPALPAV